MIIQIVLFIMAILNVACGFAALSVSQPRHRFTSFWYLLANVFTAIWAISIAIFSNLGPDDINFAPTVVGFIYASAPPLILSLAGYNSWDNKIGRALVVVAAIVCSAIVTIVITCPEALYTGITLTEQGNSVQLLALNPLYICYAIYMLATTAIGISCTMNSIMTKKRRGHHISGELTFFICFSITMFLIFFVDLIMPAWDYSLVWLGPIITAIANLAFFYRLIKQYTSPINTRWFVFFAYAVVAAAISVAYLILFNVIFTALFHGSEPSPQVLILNFIMFLVVILSAPAFREIWTNILSTIIITKINLPYITRKLSQYAANPSDYCSLADLLTTHLHFTYVGLLINGKLYNPAEVHLELSRTEISAIANLPLGPTLWQRPDEEVQLILNQHEITSIASLGAKHQILVGKSLTRKSFTKKELAEIETILNLVAAVI